MHDDPATGQPTSVSPDDGAPAASDSIDIGHSQLPSADRSPDDRICPFLRAAADGGVLGRPVGTPDPANRCVALQEPVPQSLRQQELVCLASAHVNCPRYLRGSVGPTVAPTERVTATRMVTPATAGALALFGLAFVLSVGFVVASGGLSLTAAVAPSSPGGAVLGEVDTAAPTPDVTAGPSVESTPEATPLPTPSSTASPSPSPTPAEIASPSPEPTPKASPKPTSNRYALLTPCTATPGCYVYVVRSGDNLFSIAKYFGVPLKTVKAMNPWTQNGLTAGRQLRIPPPTR